MCPCDQAHNSTSRIRYMHWNLLISQCIERMNAWKRPVELIGHFITICFTRHRSAYWQPIEQALTSTLDLDAVHGLTVQENTVCRILTEGFK